jgi:HlyD family secretion protein
LKQLNYTTQEALAQKNLISEYDLKTSKNELDGLAADIAIAEADLKDTETQITQYAYITSPIDGIVLDRTINVGDTVVDSSSSNSSSIFTLAENLTQMQIEAMVGELDVASIYKGQQVRFSMESFPGRSFPGVVETLRMVPVIQNSVVNYTVIINVENKDGSLMPGMTCAVDFIVERSEDALVVSNAALRYQPSGLSDEQIDDMVFNAGLVGMDSAQRQAAIEQREQAKAQAQTQTAQRSNQNAGIAGMLGGPPVRMMGGGGRPRQGGQQGQTAAHETVVMRNLWFIGADGKLDVMRIQTGISDGTLTELLTDEALDGRQVILREKI